MSSLQGSLVDISVVDLLQFVHLSGRSGTLLLVDGAQRSRVTFHRGRVVGAEGPRTRRLGDILIEEGSVTRAALDLALAQQTATSPRRSIGRILVDSGALAPAELRRRVEQQVEHTVYDLVTLRRGRFEFHADELTLADDIAVDPAELLLQVDLNTQALLLEAVRIFDEHRERGRSAGTPVAASEPAPVVAAVAAPAALAHRLQVVSPVAAELAQALAVLLPPPQVHVVPIGLRDAGSPMPGEGPPVVLFDLRGSARGGEALARLRRTRPRAPVLAIAATPPDMRAAFEAGALAVVPADHQVIAAGYRSLLRQRHDFGPEVANAGAKQGLAKLRSILPDLRSGLLSATVSLSLMNIVADSVERAVLFMVRKDRLLALGAFGQAADGRGLAESTATLNVSLSEASVLAEAARDGRSRSIDFSALPARMANVLGRPLTGQGALLPVQGTERVIALVYADNGRRACAIEQVDILELAAAHVGVTFENELLRRRLAQVG